MQFVKWLGLCQLTVNSNKLVIYINSTSTTLTWVHDDDSCVQSHFVVIQLQAIEVLRKLELLAEELAHRHRCHLVPAKTQGNRINIAKQSAVTAKLTYTSSCSVIYFIIVT